MKSAKARALSFLRNSHNPQLDFIALALHGEKVGFDKVIKMIDEMVALLKQEQTDDENKKEYCSIQFDSLGDKKKGLELTISDAEKTDDENKKEYCSIQFDSLGDK